MANLSSKIMQLTYKQGGGWYDLDLF